MQSERVKYRTDLELLGRGHEHYPAYQPIPRYNSVNQYGQPPQADLPPYPQPMAGRHPTPSPLGSVNFLGNLPLTIPEDPPDTRPSYVCT